MQIRELKDDKIITRLLLDIKYLIVRKRPSSAEAVPSGITGRTTVSIIMILMKLNFKAFIFLLSSMLNIAFLFIDQDLSDLNIRIRAKITNIPTKGKIEQTSIPA